MATIRGTSGNDSLANGSTGSDLFATALGHDYVQATKGNDTYHLGYARSASYWKHTFADFDTVDYRHTWSNHGFASDTGLKIVVDLEMGTVQKLNAAGGLLHTDKLIGVDGVYGTAAADRFYGRDDWDFDLFFGSRGGDFYDGRAGIDGVSYQFVDSTKGIEVQLAAGRVKWLDGGSADTLRQIEWIRGTEHADHFNATGYGGSSANKQSWGEDWNLYDPRGGDDTVIGNGSDVLRGGSGRDVFRFDSALNGMTDGDKIVDFVVADDTIELDSTLFTALTSASTPAAGQLRIGTAAADRNDYLIYNPATGALYYDADGSGAATPVQFAALGTGLALTVSDFFVT